MQTGREKKFSTSSPHDAVFYGQEDTEKKQHKEKPFNSRGSCLTTHPKVCQQRIKSCSLSQNDGGTNVTPIHKKIKTMKNEGGGSETR